MSVSVTLSLQQNSVHFKWQNWEYHVHVLSDFRDFDLGLGGLNKGPKLEGSKFIVLLIRPLSTVKGAKRL